MKWKDKTRDGSPVRIYAEEGAFIHGAILRGGRWCVYEWHSNGGVHVDREVCWDLIPADPPVVVSLGVRFAFLGAAVPGSHYPGLDEALAAAIAAWREEQQ